MAWCMARCITWCMAWCVTRCIAWCPPLHRYAAKMISGEFTGTMCLTEPQCGSDLGQVTTQDGL